MTKDRPKKPAVSMRKETYERLKEEADKRGMSIPALLEEIVGVSTPKKEVDHREAFGGPVGTMSTPQDSPMLANMRSR